MCIAVREARWEAPRVRQGVAPDKRSRFGERGFRLVAVECICVIPDSHELRMLAPGEVVNTCPVICGQSESTVTPLWNSNAPALRCGMRTVDGPPSDRGMYDHYGTSVPSHENGAAPKKHCPRVREVLPHTWSRTAERHALLGGTTRAGRDDVDPCRLRRVSKPVVIGEDGVDIEPNRGLQVQGVKGTQILHRQ